MFLLFVLFCVWFFPFALCMTIGFLHVGFSYMLKQGGYENKSEYCNLSELDSIMTISVIPGINWIFIILAGNEVFCMARSLIAINYAPHKSESP